MHRGAKSKRKWHTLVKRALNHERRYNQVLPNEWRGFSNAEVNMLFELADDEISIESVNEGLNFLTLLEEGSEDFLEQCLYASIRSNNRMIEDKFLPLFRQIDELVDNGKIKYMNKKKIHQSILYYVVERENVEALKTVLSEISLNASHQNPTFEREETISDGDVVAQYDMERIENPENNSDVLLSACGKNNYRMVQALVSAGYR